MSLAPGTRVGAFEIGAPLDAGGMGEVYHDSRQPIADALECTARRTSVRRAAGRYTDLGSSDAGIDDQAVPILHQDFAEARRVEIVCRSSGRERTCPVESGNRAP